MTTTYSPGTWELTCAECKLIAHASDGLRGMMTRHMDECLALSHAAEVRQLGEMWQPT